MEGNSTTKPNNKNYGMGYQNKGGAENQSPKNGKPKNFKPPKQTAGNKKK